MADHPPMATPRVAAGALIRSTDGKILIVKPTYKDAWEIPGGYVEPGESPRAACIRELKEEIGLPLNVGPVLVIDRAPHPAEGDKLLFVFDGGHLSDAEAESLVPDGTEIREVRFHTLEEAASQMPDRLSRRLALAMKAATEGNMLYAENGINSTPSS